MKSVSETVREGYAAPSLSNAEMRLSEIGPGFHGAVTRVEVDPTVRLGGLSAEELELRLTEMGFVEGARVEFLHQGLFGADPFAVKLDAMRIALRRREAVGVFVRAAVRGPQA